VSPEQIEEKTMADTSPQDNLMPFGKLKQFLGHAEEAPRGVALALTKDKKDVLILIGDKSTKPKKVAAIMKKKAEGEFDPNLLRFGRVSFDMKNDKGTVRFDLNKNVAGGMLALTVKLMKKATYEGAVFNEVPSLEDESEEEDIPVAPPPPPVETPIDAAALKARLTALVQRIPAALAADPTRKEALLGLAKQAQLMLGTNNLKTATKHTDDLEAALGPALPSSSVPPPPPPPPPGTPQTATAVTYAKSRLAWLAARQRVVGEVAKLRGQLLAEYKDAPESVEILDAYDTRSADLLAGFDEQLADKLDEATNAEDTALRAKLVAEARAVIDGYQKHLDSEKLIADLDENPFVPLTIRATMGATLKALAAAIH
jgi:hypothetical protein